MLDRTGAVEADWPDEGVAAHYGDPMREQRVMSEQRALVDRSNRGIIKITGQDRLSWLHSLTSQHLEHLAPQTTAQSLILDPQGRLEHHLTLTDDGAATWIHVEPHTAKALADYLNSMRFMLRVEVEDLSGVLAVATIAGPLGGESGKLSSGTDPAVSPPATLAAEVGAVAVMQGPFGIDLIVAADAMGKLAATFPVAGLWAFEAARIAAHVPRPGLDTDHKTVPHEVGLIETAVHLSKGCYRGQETVARIHNLGHPPRRLVFLHLDGSADRLPAHGSPITLADGTPVGTVGSAARHYELGPIGLGLVKRTVPVDATLLADGVAAAQEVVVSPDAGANVKVTLRRDAVPQPPAGRKTLLSGGVVLRKALLAAAASERVRELLTGAPAANAVVSRYVAGESIQDALDVARVLRSDGLLVSLDYLGEDSTDAQRAAATAAQYVHLLGRLAAEGLSDGGAVEVSVKPTAIGAMLGAEGAAGPSTLGERIAAEHLERIAIAARDAGTTVTVDAEDHTVTDAALRIAAGLRARPELAGSDSAGSDSAGSDSASGGSAGGGSVGSVVQAALRRTEGDVRELAAPGVRVRLCKGAYAEPPAEAFTARHDIDRSFARCLRTLMAGPGYPMIATHDPRLIAITRSLGLGRAPGSFEYQMLYGVRPDEQRRLAASGARVRVYVPYGGDWYRYLVRRLAERPANLALFLRSLSSSS